MSRLCCAVAAIGLSAFVMIGASGCQKTSRTSVRTYDYDDSGAARRHAEPVETEREIDSGEWEMVAPGEMVPPGQPVVEPRR